MTPVLETSLVAEVACLGKVPTRNAARETAASSAEVASAKGAAYASAAGLHASRIDGSRLRYNQPDPLLPDLLICRPELAEPMLAALAEAAG